MKALKRRKLEAAGWKVGTASEFLELNNAEAMLVHMKLALATKVRELRQRANVTQNELAELIGSSQSRVAKLETADRSVSMELLVKSLATLGASQAQIGRIVGTNVSAQKKSVRKKRLVNS